MESDDGSTFQFALLHHTFTPGQATARTSSAHFDLLLESPCRGHLLTWELQQNPLARSSPVSFTATQLDDHRLVYLQYEGPVSDNRGSVQRILGGSFHWLESSKHRVVVDLAECQLRVALERQTGNAWIGESNDLA